MMKDGALKAHRRSSAHAPSGLRRLSLAMIGTGKLAEEFKGAPEGQGATRPGQVLAAFKAAAPHLGFNPRVVHVIDWLFAFTQPQDWLEGSRPIVWPSAAMQREALGLGATQAKAINRHLVELGLVVMKDSPNGKRYGRRDRQGRVVEAYGFDLSPLFVRMGEFQAVAAQGRELREEMRRLRRRATIARNGLLQILETAAEQGFDDASWQALEREGRALARSLRNVERVEEMAIGAASLERRQMEARERLENQLAAVAEATSKAVDSDPKGPENRPHIYNYQRTTHPEKDTVIAREVVGGAALAVPSSAPSSPVKPMEGALRLKAPQLLDLAPRLDRHVLGEAPGWSDVVNAAASGLRPELGVSPSLWGEACRVMGREQAAVALAIVSTKEAGHFTRGPGGYFAGMVRKAKRGDLHLDRTIWALREARWARRPGEESGSPLRTSVLLGVQSESGRHRRPA